jgi:predicted ester cyclase
MNRTNLEVLTDYIRSVWGEGDPEAARRFMAPGYRRHISPTLEPLDPDAQVARLKGIRAAFADVRIGLDDAASEGSLISFRSTMQGTHTGTFLGLEPTGKEIDVGLLDMIRIEDGLFVDHWGGPDVFDLLRQLGAGWSLG